MMQTSHFPPQPGMQMPQGHMMGGPGPGHPMQQGMQMHPGVSGPNGPVSQAGPMMGGMQPGVGPNAHALQHLQPQQAHMFQQQQQQQHMMNPALLQQRNQAALLQRQQQQQQMLAQQQQNGMVGMGFQQHMANMNPQQIAGLQGNMPQPFVQLPPHLRVQQQQAMAQQQQQQQTSNPQQAAAIAQAQAQAHAQQQAAALAHVQQAQQAQHQQQQQQQQQLQQQQAIAMQHAQSQQSNHSQSGSQGPPTTQPSQTPLRPPSAVSHQGQASPAPQPTPQQQPQQLPQSGPQPPQQTSAPNQPPSMPQQTNQQPQNQSQIQQRNPAMNQQPTQQQVVVQAQAQAQVHAARLAMMQRPPPSNGQGILKLMLFVDDLGKFNSSNGGNTIEHWKNFTQKFFTESGSFIHVLFSAITERTKMFEIVHAALPRYFLTQFNTDVENLQITLDGATEKNTPPECKVTCDRAKFIYTYKNQCQVVCHGRLTAFWTNSEKMEWLQFEIQGYQQLIPKALLESLFVQEEINPLNANQSPRMSNKSKQKQRAAQIPAEPSMPISRLPSAGITDLGLPPALQSYLEIYETMNNMTSLLTYYNAHEDLTPSQAMDQWNNMMSASNPAMAQQGAMRVQGGNMPPGQGAQQPPQQGMPPGSRTPSGMGQPGLPPNQQFMSPAMANSLLPNGNMSSPHLMNSHTPSPASHQMVHQQSQSGSSASQNTSPNVSNKRRRSAVKTEGDDGGGPDVNGAAKVKQSPRVGSNKRAKNNN